MKSIVLAELSLAYALACATSAQAQKSVPITSEPHHHLVYTSDRLRVFRVEVPKGTSTLLHEHAVDYFWVGVGPAEFENQIPGKPDAKVDSNDGRVHFTRGAFAHVAKIDGPSTFYNVTFELPLAQTNPRNLCVVVLPDQKMNCPAAESKRAQTEFSGALTAPEFETDQTRVTMLILQPDAAMEFKKQDRMPVLVAVDNAQGTLHTTCRDPKGAKTDAIQPKSGDSFAVVTAACVLHNASASPVRFLAVEFAEAKP